MQQYDWQAFKKIAPSMWLNENAIYGCLKGITPYLGDLQGVTWVDGQDIKLWREDYLKIMIREPKGKAPQLQQTWNQQHNKKVLMPVCIFGQWTLLVFHLKEKRVVMYCSLGKSASTYLE